MSEESQTITLQGLDGDVIGPVMATEVKAIRGIQVVCIQEPKEGQMLVYRNNRFILEDKINYITIQKNQGLEMEDGELSIKCSDLIEHCNILTEALANAKFLSIEGGTITGNLRVNGSLSIPGLSDVSNQVLIINPGGIVTSIPIPGSIDPDLNGKANINGDNIDITAFRLALGINNVNNTTDLLKPVSTATQAGLNLKANVDGNNLNVGIYRAILSVNNVDNTSDILKPISTATQTALNLKANVLGDNLDVASYRTALSINNVNNTTDALKPISTATQVALNLKADNANIVLLTTDQSINGLKTFNNVTKGQTPVLFNHIATKGYTDETLANLVFNGAYPYDSVFTTQVTQYRDKLVLDGYLPNEFILFQYNSFLRRISNITNGILPEFMLHPTYSFNLSSGVSTRMYNAGTINDLPNTMTNMTSGANVIGDKVIFNGIDERINTNYTLPPNHTAISIYEVNSILGDKSLLGSVSGLNQPTVRVRNDSLQAVVDGASLIGTGLSNITVSSKRTAINAVSDANIWNSYQDNGVSLNRFVTNVTSTYDLREVQIGATRDVDPLDGSLYMMLIFPSILSLPTLNSLYTLLT